MVRYVNPYSDESSFLLRTAFDPNSGWSRARFSRRPRVSLWMSSLLAQWFSASISLLFSLVFESLSTRKVKTVDGSHS